MIDQVVPEAREKMIEDIKREKMEDPNGRKVVDNYVKIRERYMKTKEEFLRKVIPLVGLEPVGADDYATARQAYSEMRQRLDETNEMLTTVSRQQKDVMTDYQKLIEEDSLRQEPMLRLRCEDWDMNSSTGLLQKDECHSMDQTTEITRCESRLNQLRVTSIRLVQRRRFIQDRLDILKKRARGAKANMCRRSSVMIDLMPLLADK